MATYLPPLNLNEEIDARTYNYQDDEITVPLSQCPPIEDVTSWRVEVKIYEPRKVELKQVSFKSERLTLRKVFIQTDCPSPA